MGPWFNWPPFVAVPIDTNTGKPLDPNVGMRVKREFYNVSKDSKGKKMIVAHRSRSGAAAAAGEGKKEGAGNGKENGKQNGKKGGQEKKADAAGGGGAEGGQKKEWDAPWTTEDDETLKRMKAENKTWKEIVEVLGRNAGAHKKRYKEIGGDAAGNDTKPNEKKGNNKQGGNNNNGDEGKNANNKNENKNATKADKKPDAAPAKPASAKAPSVARSDGQARFTMQEWMTLQEDDVFSFGELQYLSELMLRDECQRWMRVASAFYDRTGRRVHPEDVREKFEEMGGMGSQR